MTHLMRWLFYLGLFGIPYFAIIFGVIESQRLNDWIFEIKLLPLLAIFLFGVYSVIVVLYRVLTFNNCPEAATELQEQIKEARKYLISKGFKFRD